MVVFISSFQLYFIDTHIYLSLNVPHLSEKWKTFFLLYWWLMSHNLMWITLPIWPSLKLQTMHVKLTSTISMSRGLICAWTKVTNLGKHLLIFRRWKDIWGCLKRSAVLWITLPYMYYLYTKSTNIAIEANVKTITYIYNEPYKNFTRSCLHRKNKWKHKFVNYVTVNYVTTILLKSKYLSKCIL